MSKEQENNFNITPELFEACTVKPELGEACKIPEQEQTQQFYYFFDCLDGVLSDRYLTARELAQLLTGAADPMSEREIIKTARNYEATLYRYTLDADGNPTNEKCIYDPFDM